MDPIENARVRKCGAAACGRKCGETKSAACEQFLKKCGRTKKSAASAAKFDQKSTKFSNYDPKNEISCSKFRLKTLLLTTFLL